MSTTTNPDTGCRVCGWEDYTPICPSCRLDAQGRVDAYLRARTSVGSAAHSLQQLVRRAVIFTVKEMVTAGELTEQTKGYVKAAAFAADLEESDILEAASAAAHDS